MFRVLNMTNLNRFASILVFSAASFPSWLLVYVAQVYEALTSLTLGIGPNVSRQAAVPKIEET